MSKKFVIATTVTGLVLTSVSGVHLLQASQTEDAKPGAPVGVNSNSSLRALYGSKATPASKQGNQKVLVLMINMSDSPFQQGEDYYNNVIFGGGPDSVKSYIEDQSNNKFTISPVTTTGTTHQGVIKVDLNSDEFGAVDSSNYEKQHQIVNAALEKAKAQIDFSSADANGDNAFNDSWFTDNDNNKEELQVTAIISGNAVKTTRAGGTNIQSWPHSFQLQTNVNGYTLHNSGLVTSERVNDATLGASIFSHEFLHNLNARDMYNDNMSIGLWSIMDKSYGNRDDTNKGFHSNTLDPVHKLKFGWATAEKVDLSATQTLDIRKDKVYYIQDPADTNIVYLLDYRDFDNIYEHANYRYGLRGDGLILWRIDKAQAATDWNDSDWAVNTQGPRTSMYVIPKDRGDGPNVANTMTPVGQTLILDNLKTSITVNNHQLVVKPNAEKPVGKPTINAIDRKIKQGSVFKEMEGVTATASDGTDITEHVTVNHNVNTTEPGDYVATYSVEYNGESTTKSVKVTVEPNTNIMAKPTINAENKTLSVGDEWKPKEGVTATDGNGNDITKDIQVYEDTVNTNTEGRYIVVYGVTDSIGQETVKDIVVTVVGKSNDPVPEKDTTPPVIEGADSKVIKVGEKFSPLAGVSAKDNVDDVVEVRVASSNLNNKQPGTYQIVYEAIDKAGNKATVTRTITVIADEGEEDNKPQDVTPPKLTATSTKVKIPVGSNFDPLTLIKSIDNVDGDITHEVKFNSNVKLDTPGKYKIEYTSVDKAGNKSSLILDIEVYKSNIKFIAPNLRIHKGTEFDAMRGVKVLDESGKDVTSEVKVSGDTVNTDELGTYKVKYTFKDSNGNNIEHVRLVEVVAKSENVEPPKFKVDYRVIKQGTTFKSEEGISATDAKGNDISKNIKLIDGTIDSKVVGAYPLIYSVEDADGNVSIIDRIMYVVPMDLKPGAPTIFLKTQRVIKDSEFDPKSIVYALDKEDGLLNEALVVKKNDVDTSKLGVYKVDYSVIDSESNVANQAFDIEVVEKAQIDDKPDTDKPNPNKPDSNKPNSNESGSNNLTDEPNDNSSEDTAKPNAPNGGELNVGTNVNGNSPIPSTGTLASGGFVAGIITTLSGIVLGFRRRK